LLHSFHGQTLLEKVNREQRKQWAGMEQSGKTSLFVDFIKIVWKWQAE
jgi:fructose-1,6-bisphosphatase